MRMLATSPRVGVLPFRPRRARARRRGGMGLLDLMIALTILTVAVMSLLGLVGASLQLETVNRENTLAIQAARRAIEELRAIPFEDVYSSCNRDPSDDPGAEGSGRGANFAVDGLEPARNDDDGLVGEILMPVYANQLREDLVDAGLGTPMDLDLDGVIDIDDHADDYRVLPVTVRLRWWNPRGESHYEITTLLRGAR